MYSIRSQNLISVVGKFEISLRIRSGIRCFQARWEEFTSHIDCSKISLVFPDMYERSNESKKMLESLNSQIREAEQRRSEAERNYQVCLMWFAIDVHCWSGGCKHLFLSIIRMKMLLFWSFDRYNLVTVSSLSNSKCLLAINVWMFSHFIAVKRIN